MSSLKLLSARTMLDGINRRELRANDLVQGSELFLHMLDSSDPICTACAAAALHQLVTAGAIPVDSCLEPLLQAIQQATSTISSINSSSLTPQTEQYVLATLCDALAALGSRSMTVGLTPATLPALLKVLQLPNAYVPPASLTDMAYRMRQSSKRDKLREAQGKALSILKRFCHDTAGSQVFAAAGGIKILIDGADDSSWFYGWDSGGLCFLGSLAKDPAVAEAVVEAGAVGLLLNELHPDDIDELNTCVAATALWKLAATEPGSRAIAAAPGSINLMLRPCQQPTLTLVRKQAFCSRVCRSACITSP
jgi:hypothetical protein